MLDLIEHLKKRGETRIFGGPIDGSPAVKSEGAPVGTLVFHDDKFQVMTSENPDVTLDNERQLRALLNEFDIRDALGFIDRFGEEGPLDGLPVQDRRFSGAISLFLATAVSSIFNLHGSAMAMQSSPNVLSGGALSSHDVRRIMAMIKQGYRNQGYQTKTFWTPVFTAFPLVNPAIDVALKVSSSTSNTAGFKIKLPGISGGFSNGSSSTVVIDHPADPYAIQRQQEMEAEVTVWHNQNSGHIIESYSFRQLVKQQTVYDNGQPNNGFIDCTVTNPNVVDFMPPDGWAKNTSNPTIGFSLDIQSSFSETFSFEAALLKSGLVLEAQTECRDGFEVSYDLETGYDYRFLGSRTDTHFIKIAATKRM